MNIFKHRKTTGEASSPVVTQQTDTTSTSDTEKPIYRMTGNHLYKMDFNKNIGDKGAFVVRFSCRLKDFFYSKCYFELDNSKGFIPDLPYEVDKEYKDVESLRVAGDDIRLDIDGDNNISPECTMYVDKCKAHDDKFEFKFESTGNCIYLDESTEVEVSVYKYPDFHSWETVIKPWCVTLVPETSK